MDGANQDKTSYDKDLNSSCHKPECLIIPMMAMNPAQYALTKTHTVFAQMIIRTSQFFGKTKPWALIRLINGLGAGFRNTCSFKKRPPSATRTAQTQ